MNDDLPRAYDELCNVLKAEYPSLAGDSESSPIDPPTDGAGDGKPKEPTVITMESSVPGHGSINLEQNAQNAAWWCTML